MGKSKKNRVYFAVHPILLRYKIVGNTPSF